MATKKKTAVKKPEIKKYDADKTAFTFRDTDIVLTDKKKLFAMEYVRLKFNGAKAAIAAGYSEKTAASIASEYLTDPNIKKFVELLKEDLSLRIGIDADDIAREYAKIGFSNIKQILNDKGNLANLKDLDDDAAACISSVQIDELYLGGESVGQTKKVKVYDKIAALEKLSKMIGVDGVTKVASTDIKGNDVLLLPKKELHD